MLLRAARLSRIRVRGRLLPLIRVLSDRFRENPGIFWETVIRDFSGISWVLGRSAWVKIPGILVNSDFLENSRGFGASGDFSGKFREFLWFWCIGWLLVRISGNCEVFVLVGILNYICGHLRDLCWFELFDAILIGSEETRVSARKTVGGAFLGLITIFNEDMIYKLNYYFLLLFYYIIFCYWYILLLEKNNEVVGLW